MTAADPIPGAALVFTDGSKTGQGAYKILGQEPIVIHSKHTSPQMVELETVLAVFEVCSFSFNLVLDFNYVVNAVRFLEAVGIIRSTSTIFTLLCKLQ